MLISQRPKIFDVDLIGLLLLVLITALAGWFGVRPLGDLYDRELQRTTETASHTETQQQRLAGLQQLVSHQQRLTEQLRKSRDVLIENTGLAEVIARLGDLSSDCDLMLNEIRPMETDVEENFRVTPIELQIGGTFVGLRQFLQELPRVMPYLRAESTSMRVIDAQQGGLCRIRLTLLAFAPREVGQATGEL